jgi:hypothetical protein
VSGAVKSVRPARTISWNAECIVTQECGMNRDAEKPMNMNAAEM